MSLFLFRTDNYSMNRWTCTMNFFIHSIMYSYYSFKAFRLAIPRSISFTITVSQIAQMFIGLYVAGYKFVQKQSNTPCEMSKSTTIFCLTVYMSYFILFLNFFIRAYFMKTPIASPKKANQFETKCAQLSNLDENGNLSNKQKVN